MDIMPFPIPPSSGRLPPPRYHRDSSSSSSRKVRSEPRYGHLRRLRQQQETPQIARTDFSSSSSFSVNKRILSSSSSSSAPESWKDHLKWTCLERARRKRSELLNRVRSSSSSRMGESPASPAVQNHANWKEKEGGRGEQRSRVNPWDDGILPLQQWYPSSPKSTDSITTTTTLTTARVTPQARHPPNGGEKNGGGHLKDNRHKPIFENIDEGECDDPKNSLSRQLVQESCLENGVEILRLPWERFTDNEPIGNGTTWRSLIYDKDGIGVDNEMNIDGEDIEKPEFFITEDELYSLMQEVEEELQHEEERFLEEEIDVYEQYEEEQFAALVEDYYNDMKQSSVVAPHRDATMDDLEEEENEFRGAIQVLCPICQKSTLLLEESLSSHKNSLAGPSSQSLTNALVCANFMDGSCPFRIERTNRECCDDDENMFCLSRLKGRLGDVTEEHARLCSNGLPVQFHIVQQQRRNEDDTPGLPPVSSASLVATCDGCLYNRVIL